MKYVKTCVAALAWIFLLVTNEVIFAQSQPFICGTPLTGNKKTALQTQSPSAMGSEGAPWYIPATGTVKALIVYVQFPDDDTSDPYWPSGQLPSYSNSIIDPGVAQTYRQHTLSDFYRVMSNGSTTSGLNLIGDVYPQLVTAPHSMSYYEQNGKNFGDINKDVLASIDNNVNFVNYDNSSGNIPVDPDGVVDMVYIIYRYTDPTLKLSSFYGNWDGIAQLGTGQSTYYTNDYNSNGQQVRIEFGVEESGITIDTKDRSINMFLLAHEYGHFLFGSVHFGPLGGTNMMHDGPSYLPGGMDAYERAQLGYITLNTISSNQTINLGDYYSTGSAVKVPIPGQNNEYFIIENRSISNIYDKSPTHGVYIYHVDGDGLDNTELLTPNGFYDYAVNNNNQVYKTTPDPVSGASWLETIRVGNQTYRYPYTVNSIGRDVVNGNPEDAYNVGYAQILSPWSNPSSDGYTTFYERGGSYQRDVNSNIAVVLNRYSGSQANLSIYTSGVANVSGTISGNTTWSGFVHVSGSVTVSSGATLTINSGTNINLDPNVSITVNPDAKIIANGTQTNPIRFERANSGQEWGPVDAVTLSSPTV